MEGIPLDIVASDPKHVILEDPRGIEFTVPREWVTGKNLEDPNEDFTMSHLNLAAPPGELEKLWQDATYEFEKSVVGVDANRTQTQSVLDEYDRTGSWMTRGGGTWSPEPDQTQQQVGTSAWIPKGLRTPKLTNTSKTIPHDAGAGLGDGDQQWDSQRNKWVKTR